jgi:membrane protease YdiL (CAAX protease family)
LCIPALIARLFGAGAHVPADNYLIWGLIVSIVAFAEEAFLRGALYEAISSWKGELAAVIATAVIFALLHGPLYGLRVVPLDLAVGLWLGALRVRSGSFMAPGIAHTVADLAGWFLR